MVLRREYRLFHLAADAEPFASASATVPLDARLREHLAQISLTVVRGRRHLSRGAARLSHHQSEPPTGGFA
jgi:hypothetical protein